MHLVLLPCRYAPPQPPLVARRGNLLTVTISSPDAQQHGEERRAGRQVDGVDVALDAFEALRGGGSDSCEERFVCAARVVRVEVAAEDQREKITRGHG